MTTGGAGRADGPAGSAAFAQSIGGAVLSVNNAGLADARKLVKRAGRRAAGQFLAEGVQAVREAISAGAASRVFFTEAGAARNPELVAAARTAAIAVDLIDERSAAGLSETVTPQGVVALCRMVDISLADALLNSPTLAVAIIEGNDPGNAGTILRTADAAGAAMVVFAGTGVDPYNGKALRATAGSIFHLDVVLDPDPLHLVAAAKSAGMQVLATTGAGDVTLDDLADLGALKRATLWLMGNEAHGLPPDVLASADARVQIPIYGRAESLNLAVAAALCLYGSARAQRGS
jgi:TrmH family RNA methyltransferase